MLRPAPALLAAVALGVGAGGHPSDARDVSVSSRSVLARSLRGRTIPVFRRGEPDAVQRVLVVGCIHGNESAGIAIADRLEHARLSDGAEVWIVPDANPDGVAARTRGDARGVDLNRNFPFGWRPIGAPGDPQYSGAGPLSEPESRALRLLVLRVRPTITIWFHQPLGVVDESGGDLRVERLYSRLAGLPLRRLPRYPGGVTDWQDHTFPGTTAFVVELPRGALSAGAAARYGRALLRLAAITRPPEADGADG